MPTCQLFEDARRELRQARDAELEILRVFAELQRIRDEELAEEQKRAADLMAEVARLEEQKEAEEAERKRQEEWARTEHYDPGYDDWELWQRRNRRWV